MSRFVLAAGWASAFSLFSIGHVYGQEIPLGTWRVHNCYRSIHSIAFSSSKVYAASVNGIVVFDQRDGNLSTLSKLDGLSGSGITFIAFDQAHSQLLASYADGTLDIVRTNEIIRFTGLKNSTTIPGSKRINHISIRSGFAYLSADYGVVVFDLNLLQVKETWRDLGPAGQQLEILESTFLLDSIFLATANGVIAGNLSTNLLDFSNWKRFNSGPLNATVGSVATFDGEIYAAIDFGGLYKYEAGNWGFQNFAGSDFNRLGSASSLMISENENLWKLNASGVYSQVVSDKILEPVISVEDAAGKIWVGDMRNGLLSDKAGVFQSYVPNGPSFPGGLRLTYNNEKIFAVSGGYNTNYTPAGKTESVNFFTSGFWNVDESLLNEDVTDISFSGSKIFVASIGSGLQVKENTTATLYTNSNSPLSTNRVTAIVPSTNGLWVTNYGSAPSLHLLKIDNVWQSFSFPAFASPYPTQMVVDGSGQVWMALNPSQGGGILVFNYVTNQSVYLTEAVGSGFLPSRSVYSLAVDRNGFVWVGTSSGVAYFPNPRQVLSGNVNAVRPIYNARPLLRDETVTALAVDGGNRKWMGTQRGVWLFSAFGEELIHNFNETNSPLPSGKISDIEVHPSTGEVFFATENGIVSFRGEATESGPSFGNVRIFPNPVTPEFSGLVSISGLSTDALVKVTDISGKLVWQTYANGGTANWNVRDYNGKRAATGMYLVIAVSQDARESVIGKIAVIN